MVISSSSASNRRDLFRRGAAMGAAAAVGSVSLPRAVMAQGITDIDILNFALNLEYLEAEYYLRGAFGRGLADEDITGSGTPGPVTGGRRVRLNNKILRQYAEEIADDEEKHVKAIRATIEALGGTPVARPAIDLTSSFAALGQLVHEALGTKKFPRGGGRTFDPFTNKFQLLLGAFVFEDVGVTAYKGAARLISNPDVLEAAAGILAVEAYHAGEIRTILTDKSLDQQANAISDIRDQLDGPEDLDQGIGDVQNTPANIVPADLTTAIAFSRTPTQVLRIVYADGSDNPQPGGFFPQGMNGLLA